MTRAFRLLGAATSFALTWTLVAAALVYCIVGTPAGRVWFRERTNGVVAGLLGPDITAELGEPSVRLFDGGAVTIGWSNVEVARKGEGRAASRIGRVQLGLSLPPILLGRFRIDRLKIAGAFIDLDELRADGAAGGDAPVKTGDHEGRPDATPSKPFLPERSAQLTGMVETQLRALRRTGVDHVSLSDITLVASAPQVGQPLALRIERADLALSDPRAPAFSAVFGLARVRLPIEARMRLDAPAGRLLSMQLDAGPLRLGDIVPPGPPEDKLDSRPFATDATVSAGLDLATSAQTGLRTTRLALHLGEGSLQIGRGRTRIEAARLGLRYVEGEDAVVLDASRLAFDDFSTTLGGRLVPIYDGTDYGFNGFGFDLAAADMRSTVGSDETKPAMASLRLAGRTSDAEKAVVLSRFDLQTGAGHLEGTGALRYGTPEARTVAEFKTSALKPDDIKAFWPFMLASNARRWVLGHVGDAGLVRDAAIALDLRYDRLGAAFKPENHPEPAEFDLGLGFEDLSIKTSGALPDLLGAGGSIRTTGGDTLVALDTGNVSGFAGVALAPSKVTFVRAAKGLPHEINGRLLLALAGPAADFLNIAGRQPINALQTLTVEPADVTGRVNAAVDLAFVLGDGVLRDSEVEAWTVALDLEDVATKKPVDGRSVSDLKGSVKIVRGTASGEVVGRIDGMPATISFVQPFGPTPLGQRHLEIAASLSGDEAAARAPSLVDVVTGPIDLKLLREGDSPFKASLDLSKASLTLAAIGWRKGKGIPATAAFDVVREGSRTTLRNVVFSGEGFSATGEVVTDKAGLRSADLSNVMLNPGDDVGVSVQRVDNGFSIRVKGARFDARPFLNDLIGSLGQKAARRTSGRRQLDIGVAIDRLTGFGDNEMRDFSLDFAGSGDGIAALSLSGRSGRNDAFTVDVSPRGAERSIKIRAPDAGTLAEFTGLYSRMTKGSVALDLIGSALAGYRGRLVAENFTLVDEPRLSRLVGSSPSPASKSLAKAVGADLRTERAFFDHASAGILYGKAGLEVSNGIIRGPVFGSSFSGTVYDAQNRIDIVGSFMPAYGVNRMFGAIPVLGQILGNGNEGGLIGITYRLDGLFSSPTLTVNPISAIAPGIFRNIFAYQ